MQSKCIACHVEGGASGNTRLVFVPESDPDHEATNLQVFRDLLDDEEDGASYILNKIQGALGHGGGIQVAAGTDEYANMERFLSLLGEDMWDRSHHPGDFVRWGDDGVVQQHAAPGGHRVRRADTVRSEEYESIRDGRTRRACARRFGG